MSERERRKNLAMILEWKTSTKWSRAENNFSSFCDIEKELWREYYLFPWSMMKAHGWKLLGEKSLTSELHLERKKLTTHETTISPSMAHHASFYGDCLKLKGMMCRVLLLRHSTSNGKLSIQQQTKKKKKFRSCVREQIVPFSATLLWWSLRWTGKSFGSKLDREKVFHVDIYIPASTWIAIEKKSNKSARKILNFNYRPPNEMFESILQQKPFWRI